ncbi:hypothetical protein DFR67_108137 [Williamsia limnetica]|jgi:hypothetical protein|uniref:Uncharacterized protein n=1 Tax=Williamsia limnetica TaxID=882452 RepID=A0A318RJ45_WILLI|nr:hypothetical protein [Williamsia limnetica]PYE16386.1 hypothetical protein DFR67_108137 [Williamsia limnetica]
MSPAPSAKVSVPSAVERHSFLLLTTAAIVGVAPLMISVPMAQPDRARI